MDIEKERPDDVKMAPYLAVITWFTEPAMKDARGYNEWLLHQIDNGKKIIVLGDYGALYDTGDFSYAENSKKVFERLGVKFPDEYTKSGKISIS